MSMKHVEQYKQGLQKASLLMRPAIQGLSASANLPWFVWMPALIIIGVYIKGVIEYEEDKT